MRTTTTRKRRLGVGELQQLKQKTRSGLESQMLDLLNAYKIPYEYEPKDKKIEWHKPITYHKYLPDIIIGGKIYEIKGYFDKMSRDKMVAICEQHPHLDITIVFQKDQPIRKGSKTMYSDFCQKKGLKFMFIEEFKQLIRNNKL